MKDLIIKRINNVYIWSDMTRPSYYLNLIFTDKHIIFDFVDKNIKYSPRGSIFIDKILAYPIHLYKKRKIEKNNTGYESVEKILNKNIQNFYINYYSIARISIKKKKLKMEFQRNFPIFGRICTFHFPEEYQYDVESVFTKKLLNKTTIEK